MIDPSPPQSADVVIIGGGVIGCFIARGLAQYDLSVVLLEKLSDVGAGTSGANSAVIHSGIDPCPGTLKAETNRAGADAYPEICRQLGIGLANIGGFIVAKDESERPVLEQLLERGRRNRVPGVRLIAGEELRDREPAVRGVAAVHLPSAGVIDVHRLVFAVAENAAENGAVVCRECPAEAIVVKDGQVAGVVTPEGELTSRVVINAAGVESDDVAGMAGVGDFTIRPRKGEYYVLDRAVRPVSAVIHPVPTERTKGICVIPTTDESTLIGPTARDVEDKHDLATTRAGLAEAYAGAAELCPGIELADVIASYAGLRAIAGDDFIIGPTRVGGFINVAGMCSPGLTAAPAIAERVASLVADEIGPLQRRPDFDPVRRAPRLFSTLSRDEQAALIAQDTDHGEIVCRCETVTKAEIRHAIRGHVGARTLDGVKYRTRAGMGRCQGAFCLPRILMMFAEELGTSPLDLTKFGPGSELFVPPEDSGAAEARD
jgi:glycerol-3-phosphate dehydrogenase